MIFKQFILFTFLSLKKNINLFTIRNKLYFSNTNEDNSDNSGNITNTSISTRISSSITSLEKIPSNALMYKYIYLSNINLTHKIIFLKKNNNTIPRNNTFLNGTDSRYNETSVKNYTEIDKIINNERKKRLLDSLTNPSISQKDKLKLLEDNYILDNNIKVINILKGGLTRDW
jgi:hypothetical protein